MNPRRSASHRLLVAGLLLSAALSPARPQPAAGPLRVSERNPRWLVDPDGRPVLLAGAHDGWELQDYAWGDANPGVLFEWERFLDESVAYGHNVLRLWCVEHTKITDDDPDLTRPMPYLRVAGRRTARDGGDRFDLDRFDPAYFERLRARVRQAGARGLYVIVMLFQGWSVEDKRGRVNPWPYHPFHRDNNVNGMDGDVDGDGQGKDLHTWQGRHAITRRQRAYVRKVIDTVNDLDNVLYEIANESHENSTEWHYRMIRFIRARERSKPKQHLIGMTSQYPAGAGNAALFNSPADWISPNWQAPGGHDYRGNPPPADGRKVVLSDTDHFFGNQGRDHAWVWKTFCRGHHLLYMDMWTEEHDDPARERVRRALGEARRYAARMNLLAAAPRGDLASTGYCLAAPGGDYLVYLPAGGDATVNLTGAAGSLSVEWLNPRTGETIAGRPATGGESATFTAPFEGDAVLYLTAAGPAGNAR